METEENAWLVPDLKDGAVFETKVVIKRSIFITTVGRVRGLDGAKKFVADISAKYSDARHNPFAFNGGPAGNSGFAPFPLALCMPASRRFCCESRSRAK